MRADKMKKRKTREFPYTPGGDPDNLGDWRHVDFGKLRERLKAIREKIEREDSDEDEDWQNAI